MASRLVKGVRIQGDGFEKMEAVSVRSVLLGWGHQSG